MTKNYNQITTDISQYIGILKQLQPNVMKGFSDLALNATKDGLLSKKIKELIALAIGISTRCDGCIGFHIKALIALNATKEEIAEVCAMCVYMGGGPSVMYAADTLRAFDELSTK